MCKALVDLDRDGFSRWMWPRLVRTHVQNDLLAAKLAIKRAILGPDNRVRPDTVERLQWDNVCNDPRLVFFQRGCKRGDLGCGQGIKRWISRQAWPKVRLLLSLETTKLNVPPVPWEFVRKDQSSISPKVMIHNKEIAGEWTWKSVGTTFIVDTRQANTVTPWNGLLICKWYVDRGYVGWS